MDAPAAPAPREQMKKGGIYTARGNSEDGWSQWTSVSEGQSTPGAPVTAVVISPNRIALFLADPGGEIYTAQGNSEDGWSQIESLFKTDETDGIKDIQSLFS
jgi:hypothetical protein